MDAHKDRVIEVPCMGTVTCVECSPFGYCDSLICYSSYVSTSAGQSSYYITLARLHPKREGERMVEVLKEYMQEKSTTCLCWSPKTFVESLPYDVILCAGGLDGRISMLRTDLKDKNDIEVIGAHSKAVNAIAFDFETGDLLASVGDDYKCIVWNAQEGEKHCELPLKSAGVDVKFHQHDSTKLLIAESSGLVLFFDVLSMAAFMSVECFTNNTLMSIDWPVYDITRVDALSSSEWCTFDTSKSCLPTSTRPLQQLDDAMIGGVEIRVSPASPKLVAISSQEGITVLVNSEDADDEMVASHVPRRIGSGLSWHLSQPLLVCGGDNKLTAVVCEHIS